MHVALITVGDTGRLTGGYLYQARVIAGLRLRGLVVDEIVASGVRVEEQHREANTFAARFKPEFYDVIIVDALARVVCAPSIDQWHTVRPVIVLVHQLASVAENSRPTVDDPQPELCIAVDRDDHASTLVERQIDIASEDALLRADLLIAVSAHGRNMLLKRGAHPERTVIISPGFDRLSGMAQAELPPQRNDSHIVLCVAQWIPRKGITTLVRAWQLAQPPAARLVLIGETDADPTYSTQVWGAIARNPHGIEVRGTVSDAELGRAYQSADLFVLASRFEGYGMVYAEALAYGLPVIATDVGPIPELVTNRAGRFVAPDDESALADMLLRFLDDNELRQILAEGARTQAAVLPTWDDAVDGFADVLRQVHRSTL